MDSVNISIVIPLYNKAQSIVDTLKCVCEQTYQNFEVIVVNDGSTDNSLYNAQKVNDKRIRIISQKNAGVSAARNAGIKAAKYDYIAFLDADDYWEDNYLEEQVKMILDFPDASLWSTAWGYMRSGVKENIKHYPDVGFRGYIENYWTMKKGTNIFWVSASIYRKDVFGTVGGFDERIKYGEDYDMVFRTLLEYKAAFNSIPLVYYVQDAENRAMNKKIDLEAFLPFYIDKYDEYRRNNGSFRHYFDEFCMRALPTYLVSKKYHKQAKMILKKINLSEYAFRLTARVRFPYLFKLIQCLAK